MVLFVFAVTLLKLETILLDCAANSRKSFLHGFVSKLVPDVLDLSYVILSHLQNFISNLKEEDKSEVLLDSVIEKKI